MSAATAQSTELLAAPLSRHFAFSWLLSAVSPAPRPLSPPKDEPVPPPPPPSTWMSTTTTSPTSPSPPPPTAIPRPPPKPPPRRSWTLDRSMSPPSRYLMLGRPPGCSEDLPVRLGDREPHLHRAVHLLTGRREVQVRPA